MDYFHLLTIVNNAAVNVCIQIPVWVSAFNSFEYILKNGISGTYVNFIFTILKKHHSGCSILYSHCQCIRFSVFPHPYQHLLFSGWLVCLLIIAILMGVKWYFIVVLVCISLMTNDLEHLFMGLLAICISSSEKCWFNPLPFFNLIICIFVVELSEFLIYSGY